MMFCIAAATAFAGCTDQTTAQDTGKAAAKSPTFNPATVSITEKTVPIYFGVVEEVQNVSVYFINGGEIPYVSLEEFMNVLMKVVQEDAENYTLTFKADGDKAWFVRENGYSADFDFADNTIHFMDLDMFQKNPNGALVDGMGMSDTVAPLYQKDDMLSYERYGREITKNLNDYGIRMVHKGDGYYMPLQTFSDLFLAGKCCCCVYNGEAVFLTGTNLSDDLSKIYYSAPKTERTPEIAEFDYNELCMALDHHYGLKEIHQIKDFDTLFTESGYDVYLKGTNQTIADAALFRVVNAHLGDLHSGFNGVSFRTDPDAFNDEVSGMSVSLAALGHLEKANELEKARNKYYPNGIPHYEEVGNTAYITFDHFVDEGCEDYYSAPKADELDNTIRLMQYAYDQITRKGSPFENVVMDLSLNEGGTVYTSVYVTGLFLGEGQISLFDELTGALASAHYKLDTNRDHVFDKKDTLAGKGYNFYCIESGVSFSCGNLVPNVFKNSERVTLIGQTSGGGSCVVQPLSTSAGTLFQVSGNTRMSFIKNGAFYDIDRGAETDIYIRDFSVVYDRQRLTDYINNKII